MIKFWEDTDNLGFKACCEYNEESGKFIITVSKDNIIKSKSFNQSFEPRFGMDVLDANMSLQIAEELAKEIEKEL